MDFNKELVGGRSMNQKAIKIVPFSINFTNQLVSMILEIQQKEFNLPITANDQPDLFDIPNFYQFGSGNFWIAISDEKVVGSIAIIDIGNQKVAMRKMFVHRNYRGRNIGTAHDLFKTLFSWSNTKGVREIFLGTTEKMYAAQKFYINHGFREINKDDLPVSFPVMDVDSRFYFLEQQSANQADE